MADSDSSLIELDQMCIDILKALEAHDGEANTRQVVGWAGIVVPQKLHYRVDTYLEPEELLTVHQPEGEPGVTPPKEFTLTEHGEEYLEKIGEKDSARGIAERLERVEQQLDKFKKANQELREENQELRESDVSTVVNRVPELTGDVDELQSKVRNLQDALGEIQTHPVIENEGSAAGLDDIIVMANACRRVIESELDNGDELIEEQSEIVREKAREAGALFGEN